ncbi:MAG: CocE/NonD family hydrolase [Deltaproteobacteria bacterium]|nr:CocE/NonD family hydrolase [Deltaproteobacteria bacterium]
MSKSELQSDPTSTSSVTQEKVSRFGEYRGYSDAHFDGFLREAVHVTVRDGVRIAMDIYRPTCGGVVASEPLPVAMSVTRYWRARKLSDGSIDSPVAVIAPGENSGALINPSAYRSELLGKDRNSELLSHGYTLVYMDSRGTGASFGTQDPSFQKEVDDISDVMDWLVAQPWARSKIGMFGGSWLGLIQLIAATGKPKPLAAIFPSVPNFMDVYRIFWNRGVYAKGSAVTIRQLLVGLSDEENQGAAVKKVENEAAVAAGVDNDLDGALLRAAREQHGDASFSFYFDAVSQHPVVAEVIRELDLNSMDEIFNTLMHADTLDQALANRPDLREKLMSAQWPADAPNAPPASIATDLVDAVKASGIPVYLYHGWQDPGPSEGLLYHYNGVCSRTTIGPWSHAPGKPNDPREDAHMRTQAVEIRRWFDHWLLGMDNGVEKEDPITYAVMQDKANWEWRTSESFPPETSQVKKFFFSAGPSTSIGSVNDGLLMTSPPTETKASDSYRVDYSTRSGGPTRHHHAAGGGPIAYPDFAPNDAKGLTYTTSLLAEDLVIAGFPVIRLYASASVSDLNIVVYLEDIDANGYSTMVTQGAIRTSHRTPRLPLYDTGGIPWTSSLAEDISAAAPLTEGPVEICFALEPVAQRFPKGHRMRITIVGADEDLYWTIPLDPRPEINMYRDMLRPSHIELNVLSS